MVLVSSPVAKCAYKQHRYRNKCIATGSICAWALSIGGVSPPLRLVGKNGIAKREKNLIKKNASKQGNFVQSKHLNATVITVTR